MAMTMPDKYHVRIWDWMQGARYLGGWNKSGTPQLVGVDKAKSLAFMDARMYAVRLRRHFKRTNFANGDWVVDITDIPF